MRPSGLCVAGLRDPGNYSYSYSYYSTYAELMTMRLGGMAARKRPMGRKAANALRKSLNVSLAPLQYMYSVQLHYWNYLQCADHRLRPIDTHVALYTMLYTMLYNNSAKIDMLNRFITKQCKYRKSGINMSTLFG